MKLVILIFVGIVLTGIACYASYPEEVKKRYTKAIKELNDATTEEDRFVELGNAAKAALDFDKPLEARHFAEEIQKLAPKYKSNWNYGNAIEDFNIVLGRLALAKDDVNSAKNYLLAAGSSPGSPQMNTFGPNMTLAKELLVKGEKEVVIKYLDLCRSFWEYGKEKLDTWTKEVKDGKIPDFEANLDY